MLLKRHVNGEDTDRIRFIKRTYTYSYACCNVHVSIINRRSSPAELADDPFRMSHDSPLY